MIYVILVVFILAFACYFSITRSFISPFSLLLIAFIMSLSIIVSNMENWQVEMNPRFPIYIFTAITAFAIGCMMANVISDRSVIHSGSRGVLKTNGGERLGYSKFIFFLAPAVCTVLFVFMSIDLGHSGGSGNTIFRSIYEASYENSSNFLLHQLREIVVAIAEISIMKIFVYKYENKIRIPKGLLIPSMCFAVCTLFSTDRNIFLRFIIFALCIWIFFKMSSGERSVQSTNRQILKRTVLILVIAVGLFYLLGKTKSYTSNLERTIGIYGGSGLYNFNLCLEQLENADLQYGKETFSQLIRTLQVFGIDLWDELSNRAGLGMVVFRSPNGYVYASNVYSALTPYVIDFGLIGNIIFPLVLGFFFRKIYISALRKGSLYSWGIYAMLVYAIVYFPIAEQFFMRFHLGLVYEIGWFSIIYFLVFGGKKVKVKIG
ncbi:O-antigen polymerase [Lachnospiraceae bacterium 48-21]